MTLPPDSGLLDSAGKDALTLALVERLNDLTGRIDALEAENAALRAENATLRAENAALRKENAELRAKLKLPPKNPDNSSIPPSRGQKASEKEQRKPKGMMILRGWREAHGRFEMFQRVGDSPLPRQKHSVAFLRGRISWIKAERDRVTTSGTGKVARRFELLSFGEFSRGLQLR